VSEPASAPAPLTVAEFSQRMSGFFERVSLFRDIAVSGEISGYAVRGSGIYFDLKDQGAQGGPILACYLRPASVPRGLALANGLAVVARGEIINYGPRSKYSLTVASIEATGLGLLFVEFQALKERLRVEGLFESGRKRALPRFPHKIAVVSTRGGKGIGDFLTEIAKRAPFVQVSFFDTRVQGIGAEREIAAAIARADGSGAELIVVGRGGGSYEELFTFNREEVVRAIVATHVPVVIALAHTDDIHLADLVADGTANTPSLAVALVLEEWSRAAAWLPAARDRLASGARRRVDIAAQRLDTSRRDVSEGMRRRIESMRNAVVARERALVALDPRSRLIGRRSALVGRTEQLVAAMAARLQRCSNGVATRGERLPERIAGLLVRNRARLAVARASYEAGDPAAPLQRGYAMVMRGGEIVRNVAQLRIGDEIEARFGRGSARARIERIENEEGQ